MLRRRRLRAYEELKICKLLVKDAYCILDPFIENALFKLLAEVPNKGLVNKIVDNSHSVLSPCVIERVVASPVSDGQIGTLRNEILYCID